MTKLANEKVKIESEGVKIVLVHMVSSELADRLLRIYELPGVSHISDRSETMSREETAQLASRQEKFIGHLESALRRIENKTYGICRDTGKLIRKERLKLVPHATLSIEAKQQQDRR